MITIIDIILSLIAFASFWAIVVPMADEMIQGMLNRHCPNDDCVYYSELYKGCMLPANCIYWPVDDVEIEMED